MVRRKLKNHQLSANRYLPRFPQRRQTALPYRHKLQTSQLPGGDSLRRMVVRHPSLSRLTRVYVSFQLARNEEQRWENDVKSNGKPGIDESQ